MLDAREIYPLSDFQRNAKQFIEQLQESRKPIVLTVNGKASIIMQDAASYQELLDELTVFRSATVTRQGMAEAAAGQDRDALEALEELRVAQQWMTREEFLQEPYSDVDQEEN